MLLANPPTKQGRLPQDPAYVYSKGLCFYRPGEPPSRFARRAPVGARSEVLYIRY
jgi:hypothetical protein